MVKVAIAGGSGQVSREVIDALLASQKHEILVLSRSETSTANFEQQVEWRTVDYSNKDDLAKVLQGVHTLLSFIQTLSDPDQHAQKNLIDAAISAGVKRFAPSEYGSKETVDMPWWEGKERVREYLRHVNQNGNPSLEYTLFQPGLFLDYLAFPYKTAKYVDPLQTVFDFKKCRAIVVDGHEDAIMTLTTVADFAAIVARAVEYVGTWPINGGIRANSVTFSQIIEIGERVRGMPFSIDRVQLDDLKVGNLKASWGLEAVHHAVSQEDAAALLRTVSIGILLSSSKGAWDVSDDFNQLFPDYKFAPADEFLRTVWEGKGK